MVLTSTSYQPSNSEIKNNSSDWAFNLRTLQYDASDSDSDFAEDNDDTTSKQPVVISEDAQLLKDLDLSSRQETVEYKPNPWKIAKINAASRPLNTNVVNKVLQDEVTPVPSTVPGGEKKRVKAPKGRIVDAFKKQAARPTRRGGGTVLKPRPQVSILPPVVIPPSPGSKLSQIRSSSIKFIKNANDTLVTGQSILSSTDQPALASPISRQTVSAVNTNLYPCTSKSPGSSSALPPTAPIPILKELINRSLLSQPHVFPDNINFRTSPLVAGTSARPKNSNSNALSLSLSFSSPPRSKPGVNPRHLPAIPFSSPARPTLESSSFGFTARPNANLGQSQAIPRTHNSSLILRRENDDAYMPFDSQGGGEFRSWEDGADGGASAGVGHRELDGILIGRGLSCFSRFSCSIFVFVFLFWWECHDLTLLFLPNA